MSEGTMSQAGHILRPLILLKKTTKKEKHRQSKLKIKNIFTWLGTVDGVLIATWVCWTL
jgi:hypothetical protein